MKKFNFSKVVVAVVLSASLLSFIGCKPTPDETANNSGNTGNSTTVVINNNPSSGTGSTSSTSGNSNDSNTNNGNTNDNNNNSESGIDGVVRLSETDALIGKWVDSSSATYEISKDTLKNYGTTYDSYAGNDLYVKKTDEKSGIIYIKYTKSYEETTEDKSEDSSWTAKWNNSGYYRYSTTAPDVGKWYAVAYKDLSDTGIFISGAYNTSRQTSTNTLQEAVTEFTLENSYFDFTYGECSKSNN